MKNPKYWLQKRVNRKTGYPLATVAYYGPDDTRASKVVVVVIHSEQEKEPSTLQKWFSDMVDLRHDLDVTGQIIQFIDSHQVARVAMMDRIIGCPHEEGVDYPLGEKCLQCPFWAGRNRWTGEKL